MSKKTFDVAIVGTGPAGMFAALKFLQQRPSTSIIMFEKGHDRRHQLVGEDVDVTAGWGGAGACSDGKYNLDETGRVGGRLVTDGLVALDEYKRLLHEAAQLYVDHGGDSKRMYGVRTTDDPDEDQRRAQMVQQLQQKAEQHRMRLHTFPILHLGTTTARVIVDNIRQYLEEHGVTIHVNCMVNDLADEGTHWQVLTQCGDFNAKYVIMAPGRSGATWFREFAGRHNVELCNAGVDIGVRVECSQSIMSPLTDLLYEAKVYFMAGNDDKWRTFCMCPNGRVAVEHYQDTGILCANGHTDPVRPSENCNFSVLGTQEFTRPFRDPLAYGRWVARLHNELAGGNSVLVQRLGDLEQDRRSTLSRIERSRLMVNPTCLVHDGSDPDVRGAVPGDIRCAMPGRFTLGLRRFFQAFAHIAPGIDLPDTLMYAPEIKLHSSKAAADHRNGFQILPRVCVAGDGVGFTRGLNGASIHGMYVAEWLVKQLG